MGRDTRREIDQLSLDDRIAVARHSLLLLLVLLLWLVLLLLLVLPRLFRFFNRKKPQRDRSKRRSPGNEGDAYPSWWDNTRSDKEGRSDARHGRGVENRGGDSRDTDARTTPGDRAV